MRALGPAEFAQSFTDKMRGGELPRVWIEHVGRCSCRDAFVLTAKCSKSRCVVHGMWIKRAEVAKP